MTVAEVVMAVVSRGGKSWPPKVELPAVVEIEDHRLLVLKARRACTCNFKNSIEQLISGIAPRLHL